ncbi:response regulator [Parashewanella spongiae]|uniref:Response regulator n=1 Tax=Parashewanella spongiae TaxID=342950 RepID=A0A3A6U2H4_9GAMM|nr:response regulator [Parashewanella spongiae]MCL1077672.1 response regulator [Parashewanella spongiae]RJY18242.1 response regulator [Parashewanella spongiae]
MALYNISVLLVEVDPHFSKLANDFLIKQGAKVTQAQDGYSGIEAFKKGVFDIVIADLSLATSGGLDLLHDMSMLDPSVPSIVLSGNNVMTDVIEALRLGASDYLLKPIDDFYTLEHAIQQCLAGQEGSEVPAELVDELAYQEFQSHIEMVEQNVSEVRILQQQLFPSAETNYPSADVFYSLFKHQDVSSYLIDSTLVGDQHLLMYMAHFHPEDDGSAFASVLLRSLVNQKLKSFRVGKSQAIIEPFSMLSYLNDRLIKSGIDVLVDMIYVTVDLRNFRTAIAQAGQGLRCYLRNNEGLMPLALSDTMQLGVHNWGKSSTQYRTLNRGEYLCISTSAPEHKPLLLQNQFVGLVQNETVPAGGYIELRV